MLNCVTKGKINLSRKSFLKKNPSVLNLNDCCCLANRVRMHHFCVPTDSTAVQCFTPDRSLSRHISSSSEEICYKCYQSPTLHAVTWLEQARQWCSSCCHHRECSGKQSRNNWNAFSCTCFTAFSKEAAEGEVLRFRCLKWRLLLLLFSSVVCASFFPLLRNVFQGCVHVWEVMYRSAVCIIPWGLGGAKAVPFPAHSTLTGAVHRASFLFYEHYWCKCGLPSSRALLMKNSLHYPQSSSQFFLWCCSHSVLIPLQDRWRSRKLL